MLPQVVSERQSKKHYIDEDNTFLPPALSSYSIALLNERINTSKPSQNPSNTNTSNEVTGIYELDFQNKNKLKRKLSNHFNQIQRANNDHDQPSFGTRKASFEPQPSFDLPKSTIHSIAELPNISDHDMNQKNNLASQHTGSHSSDRNSLNLTNLSNHLSSHSKHTNPHSDSYSNHTSLKSITKDTSPGGRPPSQESGRISSERIMPPVKKLRGPKRFGKLLGPPQRVVRTASQTSSTLQEVKPLEPKISSRELDLSFLDKDKEAELRKRIEEQKKINEIQSQQARLAKALEQQRQLQEQERIEREKQKELEEQKRQEQQRQEQQRQEEERRLLEERKIKEQQRIQQMERESRKPLSDVPQNNVPGNAMFRKPKPPKFESGKSLGKENQSDIEPVKQSQVMSDLKAELPPAIILSIQARKAPSEESGRKTVILNNIKYEKLELLGRGGSSKVYKVKSLSDNRLYALKKVTFDQFDESCVKGFKGEVDLLLKLKLNPRVVQLIDYAIGEGQIFLVMEIGEIDLSHILHNRLTVQDEKDLNFIKFYTVELLRCVQTVHKADIVHSDLKPANFLLVKGVLKIIDFGIANSVPDHTANIYRDAQIGTPNFMAPEALVDANDSLQMKQLPEQKSTWKVGKPSDIWSCGCIIYQMIYGKPPYGKYSGNQRIIAIMNPNHKIQYPSKGIGGVKVPTSAIELMQNCLARDPNDRWTVEQCLNCEFVKPKIVTTSFISDIVHLTINFGYNNRVDGTGIISADVYDSVVETVMKQIENLNYNS